MKDLKNTEKVAKGEEIGWVRYTYFKKFIFCPLRSNRFVVLIHGEDKSKQCTFGFVANLSGQITRFTRLET